MPRDKNQPWVANLTYVSTGYGFIDVAFVIGIFSKPIVGWSVYASLKTDFALDIFE